jgi:hypothetical protein
LGWYLPGSNHQRYSHCYSRQWWSPRRLDRCLPVSDCDSHRLSSQQLAPADDRAATQSFPRTTQVVDPDTTSCPCTISACSPVDDLPLSQSPRSKTPGRATCDMFVEHGLVHSSVSRDVDGVCSRSQRDLGQATRRGRSSSRHTRPDRAFLQFPLPSRLRRRSN